MLGKEAVEKVLSLFEPHTQVIRKGKAHKPNEFGRLVRVDEVENGIVSGYEVVPGNQADTESWLPALQHHQEYEALRPMALARIRPRPPPPPGPLCGSTYACVPRLADWASVLLGRISPLSSCSRSYGSCCQAG